MCRLEPATRREAAEHQLRVIARQASKAWSPPGKQSAIMNGALPLNGINDVLVGNSDVIRNLRRQAEAASREGVTVLIEGERGTGKDTVATAMHLCSGRSPATFAKIDCTAGADLAIFDALVSDSKHIQCTESHAHTAGMLFFDAVEDLDAPRQERLLRLIDRSNVSGPRFVCASSVPLRARVLAGMFRADLYQKISGMTIFVPPLRDRRVDIPLLAFCFLKRHADRHGCPVMPFSCDLMTLFLLSDWPGNVRELENIVARYVLQTSEEPLVAELRQCIHAPFWKPSEPISLRELRRQAIRDCDCKAILVSLNRSNWNRRRVAQELQITYRSLLNYMKRLGLPMKRRPNAQTAGAAGLEVSK
jgi:DNA-binding NtrC family response regulator